ncbi:MAG TPA: hypothetical protein VK964_18100 [Nocardioidaceae bacterium]|nr:hypothetical protein [Nocardioidaceae bacterium]
MLPIAAEIAVRMTRQQAQSALPQAPVVAAVPLDRPRTTSRAERAAVGLLRRLATASAGLADRIERPVRTA